MKSSFPLCTFNRDAVRLLDTLEYLGLLLHITTRPFLEESASETTTL